ncbi:TPA: ankyrin repeat domain-containing protein, partial [Serratia marcescens]|uniref:Ankyrin repeat domain-containing protein n=1 Tax=Serratia nevei TaxID=2703794 RepID=A0ABT7G5N6_9GAMM|nr:ankyrin repeat domain-containing protein [Serratia nevei]HAU4290901.1 ankyrin repeat domain-containing protein [Serratia marcescens]MDK5169073.1 ankyrin repeat domain-containing protein [Serratia nevei]MDK5298567.1 ankyrin repeat domain-containing protein [Serratia nevei]MEC5887181.1 ankyrin repeat domain-containing protein [Serratia nevei]HAU4297445.1 ankyrin repeat domain-containing protein [Serratia marcescens]
MNMPTQQDLINRMTFQVFGKGIAMPQTEKIETKDIYIAIQQNDTEAVDRLFKADTKHHLGMSGLYLGIAGSLGYTNVIKTLIDNGADIDANSGIALYKAAEHGFEDTVDYVLSKTSQYLNRALNGVAEKDNVEMLKHLVDKGADFEHDNDSVLKKAIYHNSEQVMKAIIVDFNYTPSQDTQEWMAEQGYEYPIKLMASRDMQARLNQRFPEKSKTKVKKMKI